MMPQIKIDPKIEREQIRVLRLNLHLLSDGDRRLAKQKIKAYREKHQPAAVEPTEKSLYYVASSRMIKDEERKGFRYPEVVEHIANGKCHHVTVSTEQMEDFTDWLDRYGCNWQEH